MRALLMILIFGLGFILDWWWGRTLAVWGVAPDWLLVATVALAGLGGPVQGQICGFLWGLCLDTLSVHLFGARALLFSGTGYLVGRSRRQMDLSSPPSQAIVVGLLSAAYFLALGSLGRLFEGAFLWTGWKVFFLGSLFNALVAPFIFSLVERILRPAR